MPHTPPSPTSTTRTDAVEPWPEVDWVGPAARVELPPAAGWYNALKPAADLLAAAVLAVLAAPIVLACWALVRLTSRGPGFYTQTRSGLGGRPYKILKLRTMTFNVESQSGIQWSTGKADSRVTRVGKFLRATHLDELPQLWNVLAGEMSLVGPRPERPEVIAAKGLAKQVPGYDRRLHVKPGVTGFAQVQLPADSTVQSVRHKVAYDLYYIANQSLWLDLRLIAATVAKSAGVSSRWLRRLFALPGRARVGAGFQALAVPPNAAAPADAAALQAV